MEKHDEQAEEVKALLGPDYETVSLKSLTLYRDYLRKHLEIPCVMTGIEDFAWDGKYVFGYNDTAEYEALKNDQPSSTDIYELKRFEDLIDESAGILVKVKRVKDNRRFILDLASLKAVDEPSKNCRLLANYSTWFINHRNHLKEN
ncbi:MAG: Calcium binding protein [Deltaproteobacteria bacterium]|nr:Calcium binding protein [Deltaproteobacteria bacterium]